MIQNSIRELVRYGLATGLIEPEDTIYTTNRLLELFGLDELEDAERYYDLEGKKTVAAYVVLTVNGTMYRYDIATKRFNPKGLVGKVLYDTTEEFYSKAHAILEENKKGEGKS